MVLHSSNVSNTAQLQIETFNFSSVALRAKHGHCRENTAAPGTTYQLLKLALTLPLDQIEQFYVIPMTQQQQF